MRTSVIVSLATALAAHVSHAAPTDKLAALFSPWDLELIGHSGAHPFREYDATPPPPASTGAPAAPTAPAAPAANRHNSNTTTCGAFESAADDAPMYTAATAVFVVPTVSPRPAFNWTRDPTVTPRIAVSTGVDGISCPEAVRAGIYATVFQNGTQQHVPFVEFSGRVYAVRIASVAPGETVRVRVSIIQDDIVNIDWSNLNRTTEAFNKNVPTNSNMCGKSVSWFVEDLVPSKALPGDFFAAFQPVHFSLLEGSLIDGNTTHFDAATASFTTENALCKVDESGTELVISST
ncbi:hypothetical protein SCUCBS95973_003318 [Sporothrix curviconia]|uniref:Concanavalin A-like lectin/glucanase n=1 Tax=Sporothrix curviconia TaxID=1260050 RepID=A0ABP0BFL9_9PEZI